MSDELEDYKTKRLARWLKDILNPRWTKFIFKLEVV